MMQLINEAESYIKFLHSLCEMGGAMKSVMSDSLINADDYSRLTLGKYDC